MSFLLCVFVCLHVCNYTCLLRVVCVCLPLCNRTCVARIVCLSAWLSTCLSAWLCLWPSPCRHISLSPACIPVSCPSVCLSAYPLLCIYLLVSLCMSSLPVPVSLAVSVSWLPVCLPPCGLYLCAHLASVCLSIYAYLSRQNLCAHRNQHKTHRLP